MNKFVLDACAVLALLRKEQGMNIVRSTIESNKEHDAKIVSSDHHEFDIIEKSENINFLWIR